MFLALTIALGMSLSAAQTCEMVQREAPPLSAEAPAESTVCDFACAGRCSGEDRASLAGICVMVCPSSHQAIVPAASAFGFALFAGEQPMVGRLDLPDRVAAPDPDPPKPSGLA